MNTADIGTILRANVSASVHVAEAIAMEGRDVWRMSAASEENDRCFTLRSDGVEVFESELDSGLSRLDFEYTEDFQRSLVSELASVAENYIAGRFYEDFRWTFRGKRKRILVDAQGDDVWDFR